MPYVYHTAWPPGAADGCLFKCLHWEQVEDATSTYWQTLQSPPALNPVSSTVYWSLIELTLRRGVAVSGRALDHVFRIAFGSRAG